jgi:hypothetical protein
MFTAYYLISLTKNVKGWVRRVQAVVAHAHPPSQRCGSPLRREPSRCYVDRLI